MEKKERSLAPLEKSAFEILQPLRVAIFLSAKRASQNKFSCVCSGVVDGATAHPRGLIVIFRSFHIKLEIPKTIWHFCGIEFSKACSGIIKKLQMGGEIGVRLIGGFAAMLRGLTASAKRSAMANFLRLYKSFVIRDFWNDLQLQSQRPFLAA